MIVYFQQNDRQLIRPNPTWGIIDTTTNTTPHYHAPHFTCIRKTVYFHHDRKGRKCRRHFPGRHPEISKPRWPELNSAQKEPETIKT